MYSLEIPQRILTTANPYILEAQKHYEEYLRLSKVVEDILGAFSEDFANGKLAVNWNEGTLVPVAGTEDDKEVGDDQ